MLDLESDVHKWGSCGRTLAPLILVAAHWRTACSPLCSYKSRSGQPILRRDDDSAGASDLFRGLASQMFGMRYIPSPL